MLIESEGKFSLNKFLFWFCLGLLFLFFFGWRIWGAFELQASRMRIEFDEGRLCLLYTSPSPRDATLSRMPSSA